MTTITIDENVNIRKSKFSTFKDFLSWMYEEYLEEKMQQAKRENNFIDF